MAESTYQSLPALLTGRYPRPGQLPHAMDHPQSLFTVLAGTYEMHTAGALVQLCPKGLCILDDERDAPQRLRAMVSDLAIVYPHLLLSADLRALLPSIGQTWRGFGRDETHDPRSLRLGHPRERVRRASRDRWENAMRFIQRIEPANVPTLHFVHLMLPHSSFTYLPSGKTYRASDGIPGLTGDTPQDKLHAGDTWNVEQIYQRHLLQVGAVDRLLGELLAHLERTGLYDRTLLVVTADHGVSFQAREPVRYATKHTFQDILPVPLLIKAPFQDQGRIDDRPTELIDVLPSIADMLETALPWPVDGRSVLQPTPARGNEATVRRAEGTERVAFSGLTEAMGRSAERRHDLFGSGQWYPAHYARGRYAALVGQRVEELLDESPTAIEVALDRPEAFLDVDPASDFMPVLMTGEVRSGEEDIRALAIAVNGTIATVTEPWKVAIGGREGRWSAVVPERVLRPGRNAVETFAVIEAAGQVRIARTAPRD